MKTYVFDIDGTICSSNSLEGYEFSEPMQDRIDAINFLFNEGNKIIFHTARGMGRNLNDQTKAAEQFYDLTVSQLEKWGVKYHSLFFGKPSGDFYIDDKAIKDFDFF